MKGIILAGGSGTRLYPATPRVSKQLLPVYDKPMIYYPLSTLMLAGIREILIISTPARPAPLSSDCSATARGWGCRLSYAAQPKPGGARAGVPHRREFLGGGPACLDPGRQHLLRPRARGVAAGGRGRSTRGAIVFGYRVNDPERYGVVEFDADGHGALDRGEAGRAALQLRRARPLLLRRPGGATSPARLKPSARGELEITDAQPLISRRGGCGREARPGHRLARHRHARVAAAGVELRPDHRGAPGSEDRLPRGDRLPHGLHRRRRSSRRSRRHRRQRRTDYYLERRLGASM